jgi:hypothetical protein
MGSFKPVFKRPEDEISKKVEDKVRIGIDSKIDEKLKTRVEGVKTEIGAKVEERFREESEKVKSEVDNKVKIEVEARVLAILKEKEDKDKSDKASKLAKAVDVAKALKGESDSEKDKEKVAAAEKEKIEKEKAVAAEKEKAEKDMLCPGCHTGHVHKTETDKSGLIYRCNDKGCGFEAVMVPRNSDYKCKNCSMPIKKPTKEELVKDMNCPFCHNTSAIKFDWSKLWSIKK